jgi:hypothetical protein
METYSSELSVDFQRIIQLCASIPECRKHHNHAVRTTNLTTQSTDKSYDTISGCYGDDCASGSATLENKEVNDLYTTEPLET